RAGDVTVLPAAGLTLEEVGYPNDADLAIRAAEARTTRSLPEDCP
ncbi:MAG TPA: tRNA pseudouridine(38-40) synthase TruA, partial [Propionibacteriaceae bacterium]